MSKVYECKGFWNDNKDTFQGMFVDSGEWNGIEDLRDEKIYYYADGRDIIGEHDEFTITEAEEVEDFYPHFEADAGLFIGSLANARELKDEERQAFDIILPPHHEE